MWREKRISQSLSIVSRVLPFALEHYITVLSSVLRSDQLQNVKFDGKLVQNIKTCFCVFVFVICICVFWYYKVVSVRVQFKGGVGGAAL